MIKRENRLHRRLIATAAALAFAVAALPALPAAAEDGYWNHTETGWRYLTSDKKAVSNRFANIDGKWYNFDQNGIMQTGWYNLPDSNVWYYFTSSGAAVIDDWQKVGNTWYYFDEAGYMVTGWYEIEGTWYYFYDNGALKTGWLMRSSKWYYLTDDGVMKTGWLLDGGKWYYLQIDGSMAVNCTLTIGGVQYSFDPNGVWWVSGDATDEDIAEVTPDTPENSTDMDQMEGEPEPSKTVPEQLLSPMVQSVASICRHRPAPTGAITGGYLQSTLVLDRDMIADFAGVMDESDLYLVLQAVPGREDDLITQLNIARRTLVNSQKGSVSKVWSAGGYVALVMFDDSCHDALQELEVAMAAFDETAASLSKKDTVGEERTEMDAEEVKTEAPEDK